MRSLTVARWKLPAALLLAFGLAGGMVLANRPGDPPPPREEKPVVPVTERVAAPVQPEAPGWKEAATLDLTGWLPGSVAYSPDGKTLLVGGTDGHVRAYEAATRKPLWDYKDESGHFAAVAVAPDGNAVAVTVRDGVKLLSVGLGEFVAALDVEGSRPTAVGWFADVPLGPGKPTASKLVFGSARGYSVKSWIVLEKASTITTSTTPPGKEPADPWAVPLAVNPRGVVEDHAQNPERKAEAHAIMTGPIDRATGKNVLWAYAAGGPGGNHLLDGHKAVATAAAWSADGKTAATGDADGTVILWDMDSFKEKARVKLAGRVAALALTADGKQAAAAVIELPFDQDRPVYHERVFVWDTAQARKDPPALPVANDQALGGPFQGTAGLAFSPDGKELTAGFSNSVHLSRLGELVGKVRVWTLVAAR